MSIIGEAIILGSGGLSSYYTINDDSSDSTVQATQYVFKANPSIITGPHSIETSTGWSFSVSVDFICNNVWCSGISGSYTSLGGGIPTWGSISFTGIGGVYSWNDTNGSWADSVYKTIIIPNSQLGDNELVNWLNQNTSSQTATTVSVSTITRTITPHPSVPVIQNVKMYPVSQNSSYSILPDNGVSAFQSASINVNINDVYLSKIIDKTISGTYENSILTTIGNYAFYSCSNLMSVAFLNCTTIRGSAFRNCTSLTTASFSNCTTIGSYAFYSCSNLKTISFPECMAIDTAAFYYCSSLKTASFPKCSFIMKEAFRYCRCLTSLYLTSISICNLEGSTAFTSTPIGGYSTYAGAYGSIYVPSSLLTSYQTATNWSYFSSRFVGI